VKALILLRQKVYFYFLLCIIQYVCVIVIIVKEVIRKVAVGSNVREQSFEALRQG
jgi:hypothetical protein